MADKEIGNAYVTVKPKVDGSFSDEIASHAGTAGTKFGGAFSVAAGNLMSQAFTQIASAAADVFVQGFNNYADFEQLTGGIETLFGELSGDVLRNANQAFKTAGMSANEYMETVTGFAASLKQSLGPEYGWQLANYADMAVQDMADNVNKMGTSMESVQYAYQGFAKQNYTMLDNLKLGYGGTKEEMERLLRDAERLEGLVEGSYDLSNFADIVSAIHAVQEEYGITGTTAKEAASTISGSLSTLSAAWDNFLTALFDKDADLQPYLDALGEAMTTAFNNIGEVCGVAISRIWELLVQSITGAGEAIGSAVADFLLGIVSNAESVFNGFVASLGEIWNNLVAMTSGAFDSILQVASDIWNGIVTTVSGAFDNILNTAQTIWNAVKTAIETPINAARDIVRGAIDAIKGFFSFQFEWPHIPLPHFNVSGSINPLDWITQGPPSFSIDWYAKGGIVDGVTLIGAGEAGPEAIVPLTAPNLKPFADAVADAMGNKGGDTFVFNITADSETTLQRLVREATQLRRQYA